MAMTSREHNNLLGILIMVRGGLLVLIGLVVGLCIAGGGMAVMTGGHRHDDHVGGAVMMAAGAVGGFVVVLFGMLDLYTGTQIRKVVPIGRTLGIVLCALMLLSFPLGTALGIYGLWFLLGDAGKALYLGEGPAPVSYDPPTQPPPNSWA